jgi:hypothetical protein
MSSVISLIFTSLPFLGLFIMGCYSCVLAIMVDDELEARKKVLDGIRDGTVLRAEGMGAQELS